MILTNMSLSIRVQWKRPRARAMMQQAWGEIRRARRNDRPALLERWDQRIRRECLRVTVE